jgi:uncharacterized protein (TIGR02453 family)
MDTKLILNFLSDLSKNNNTAWMAENKIHCDIAKKEFYNIVEELIYRMYSVDSTLKNLEPKDCIFRLNRDIRFSSDKSPYKEFMGSYILNGGKKAENAGYYIHLQPNGQSLVAAGFYMPPTEKLNLIRQEISENGDELLKIINEPQFKSTFGEFKGEKLKKSPRNFSPTDKFIELIKLKSFDVAYFYKDNFVMNTDKFLDDVISKFEIAMPLNHYLNNATNG